MNRWRRRWNLNWKGQMEGAKKHHRFDEVQTNWPSWLAVAHLVGADSWNVERR